jgi:hypothetical protein
MVVEERRIKPAARADSSASRTNLGGMTEQTGRHAALGGARSTAASTGDARRLRAVLKRKALRRRSVGMTLSTRLVAGR